MSVKGFTCRDGDSVAFKILVGITVFAGVQVVGVVVEEGDLSGEEQALSTRITPNNHIGIRESWLMMFTSLS